MAAPPGGELSYRAEVVRSSFLSNGLLGRFVVVDNGGGSATTGGFTLLEVLVALTILATALGAALSAFSGAFGTMRTTSEESAAWAVAETMLARVGHEIVVGEAMHQGRTPNGQDWSIRLVRADKSGGSRTGELASYRVEVRVRWDEGRRSQEVTLLSLRLGRTL